ncbi:MAG: Ku protein [Mollicutes bacterium]|nr:Ku protein [Mollicutes bacterium]
MTKKAISFGLVHIPIDLNPIIINNDTAFNQLHKKCGSRIKYQKICPHCKEEVKSKDIIKGYEYSEDNYVTFEDKDFEKLKLSNDTPIEIISFVDMKEVDPIYFEKSYHLKTSKTSSKAFELFKTALKKEGKVALAKTVIGTKFYYCLIRFEKNNLILNTLYFDEEINLENDKFEEKFSKEEIELAAKLIKAMVGKFEPHKYKDEYQDKIKDAIEQKISGEEIKAIKTKPQKSVNDLMKALKMSLKEVKK